MNVLHIHCSAKGARWYDGPDGKSELLPVKVVLGSEQRQTMTGFQITVGVDKAAIHMACQVNQDTGIYTIFEDDCALGRFLSPVREITRACVRRHCFHLRLGRTYQKSGEGMRGGGDSGRNSHPGIA